MAGTAGANQEENRAIDEDLKGYSFKRRFFSGAKKVKGKTFALGALISGGIASLFRGKGKSDGSRMVGQTYSFMLFISFLFLFYEVTSNALGKYIINPTFFLIAITFICFFSLFDGQDKHQIGWKFMITAFYAMFLYIPNFPGLLEKWLVTFLGTTLGLGKYGSNVGYILSFRAIYPLWLIYYCKRSSSNIARILVKWYIMILLIIVFLVPAIMSMAKDMPASVYATNINANVNSAKVTFSEAWGNVFSALVKLPSGAETWWNNSINYASGGEYYGQEEEAAEDVGVTIERLELSAPKFYEAEADTESDTVSLWGRIHGKTMKKPINLTITCRTLKDDVEIAIDEELTDDDYIPGTVSPGGPITIEQEDYIDFDCEFKNPKLSAGIHDIIVEVTYNFDTKAELIQYFIERERERELIKDNLDPLDAYKIYDKNPQGIYSAGPIVIGMGSTQPLIPLNLVGENKQTKTFGITLSQGWDGEIIKINKIVFTTPNSITLERCLPKSFPVYSGEEVESGRNGYAYETAITKDLNQPRTFDCKLIFEPSALFGGSPFKIEVLKAFINYDYRIKQELSAEVVPLPKEEDETSDGSTTPITPTPETDDQPAEGGQDEVVI